MLNSCDIADGMLLTGYADGGELPYVNQQSGDRRTTVSGQAYTVEFAPKSDPRPTVKSHYIDSVPRDAVLVIATSLESQLESAPYTKIRQSLYGGLMSTRAHFLGSRGTVVLGLIRDIEEHESLEYPVYSYGTGSCAANKTTKVVAVNEPLHLAGGKVVNPGDIVYADANGVVVVPADKHDSVVHLSERRAKANELTAEDIMDGKDCQSAQKSRREEYV